MRYPDYVKQFRPKGTVVKYSNGIYYAYYAKSKRVPEKNYPVQVIEGLAGRIDESGFHEMTRTMVDTERVLVRECGFTNFLLLFEDEYVSRRKNSSRKEARNLFRSMIVYLSNNSYLNEAEDTRIYTTEEMTEWFGIGIPNQVTAIEKICEYEMRKLEPLKYICSVQMGKRRFESELTEAQKRLLQEIGLEEKDVRKRKP